MSETGEPANKSLDDVVLPLYWAAKSLVDVIRNGDDDNGYAEMLSDKVILLERVLEEVKRVAKPNPHFKAWNDRRLLTWEYYASRRGYADKLQQLTEEAAIAAKLDDKEFNDAAAKEFIKFMEKDS